MCLIFPIHLFAKEYSNVNIIYVDTTSFKLQTGNYLLEYSVKTTENIQGWIIIRRTGVNNFGIATKLANGQGLDVTDACGSREASLYGWKDLRKDSNMFRFLTVEDTTDMIQIRIQTERQWAKFDAYLYVYKKYPGLIRWTVTAYAKEDKAFSGKATPDCFFYVNGMITQWGEQPQEVVRYSVQRGPASGILYFRSIPMNSYVFYFEDFSSLNDIYRLTQCDNPYDYPALGNPGAVRMGHPESWFQMSSPDGNNVQPLKPYQEKIEKFSEFGYERPQSYRIPKGKTVTLADTYLYLRPVTNHDNITICKNFVEMLADIYQYIYKPPMIKTDWANDIVPQMVNDIMRIENTSIVLGKYKIPRAYVHYEHEDSQLWTIVQLLHPLELYIKKYPGKKNAVELRNRLNESLPLFFDKEWKGFHNNLAPINQDVFFTVVYIFTPAVIIADLARLGNQNATTMLMGFRDRLLIMGKAYNYEMADIWLRDFSKQKGYYQTDALCCYMYVMMALYELSGGKDKECLSAAIAAAKRLELRCMDLMWEANMTAAGVVACEQLYKATGDEKYRALAYIPLANVLRECWLWESDYGAGEKTVTFWSVCPCPGAPTTAEFEAHRMRYHFKEYQKMASDFLSSNVNALLIDSWKRGPTQSRFALPPILAKEGLIQYMAKEGKTQTNCGEIRYTQMIPFEDVRATWGTDLEWWQNNTKLGAVGQEIYGAGGPIWYAIWQDELNE
ncbi:MAG: hypothetical protein N3A72_01035 [bacterium]|nr:hypothetical protein [bacterium]